MATRESTNRPRASERQATAGTKEQRAAAVRRATSRVKTTVPIDVAKSLRGR